MKFQGGSAIAVIENMKTGVIRFRGCFDEIWLPGVQVAWELQVLIHYSSLLEAQWNLLRLNMVKGLPYTESITKLVRKGNAC